jgi:hypothetical protein
MVVRGLRVEDRAALAAVVAPKEARFALVAHVPGDLPQDRLGRSSSVYSALPRFLQTGKNWILTHRLVIAAIAANLAILFLPFYDSNNIPTSLSNASHLTSHTPGLSFSDWVGGPFIFAVWVPMYLGYVLSGFNLYVAFTVTKLLFFLGLLTLAYTLKIATEPHLGSRSNLIFLFTLANPVWFYINYVFVEFDILPVACLALGYVLLRYPTSEPLSNRRLLMAVGCLTISTFFYWFAAAAIPTLVLYSVGLRQRAKLLVVTVVMFGIMGVVMLELMSGSLSILLNSFLGSNPALNRSSILGFQYFFPLSSTVYLVAAFLIVLILPLVLWQLRAGEAATLFVVLLTLVYTSAVPLPDNYIAAFPFGVLAIASLPRDFYYRMRLWCSLAFPIVGSLLVFVVIYNTQPDGQGIFFFGYSVFHANITILSPTTLREFFYPIYNVCLLLALYLSVAAVLLGTPDGRPKARPQEAKSHNLRRVIRANFHAMRSWRPSVRSSIWIGVIALLIVGSFVFNATLPSVVQYEGSGTAPTYVFLPQFVPDNHNTVRPIAGSTYLQSGPTYTIFASAQPLDFNRWFSGQRANISVATDYGGPIPPATQVLSGEPFSISLLNLTGPNTSTTSPVSPTSSVGVVSQQGPSYPVLGRTGQVSNISNGATEWFNLSTESFLARYYTYAFDIQEMAPIGTTLFHLQTANFSIALAAYGSQSILGFVGDATGDHFVNQVIPVTFSPDQWAYIEFYPTQSGLEVDLAGYTVELNESLFEPNTLNSIRLGVPYSGSGSSDFSFNGLLTSMYSSVTPFVVSQNYLEQVSSPGSVVTHPVHSTVVQFTLAGSRSSTSLWTGNTSYTTPHPLTEFSVGKFQVGSYSVTLTINRFAFQQVSRDNYYLLPVFWAAVIPWLGLVLQLGKALRAKTNGKLQ